MREGLLLEGFLRLRFGGGAYFWGLVIGILWYAYKDTKKLMPYWIETFLAQ